MKTLLEVTRQKNVMGFARGARLVMDGTDLATLAVGQTVTLEVPPGKHVLSVWLGSNSSPQSTIDFPAGETVRLECKMKTGWFAAGFVLISKDGQQLTGATVQAGHHGKLVLIFGILGFLIGILGLAAFVQGIVDLRKMSRGQMDRSGELLTWIGMILGIIGFLINVILILVTLGGGHGF